MNQSNPLVDAFLNNAKSWQQEMTELRSLILESGLNENFKWRQPCYTFENSNVCIIGGFKDFCVLSFFKGTLLKDSKGVLVAPGENSQATRQLRFTSVQEITSQKKIILEYIKEAIEIEKSGLKVEFDKSNKLDFPEELQNKLSTDTAFKEAFLALTPGRQRAYNMFFSAPKQSQTRTTRIEKYTERILNGKGMNDCVCGHSKKMPACDGSHKHFN